ncbi:hypothetical protein GCM10010918_38030 [Paenibacillus radicis (ex Gao et al. 2016)]|uniref:Uncharacterized protein n=1 Tax=Paenibacillus radicis (ex Gao et al. 2016) TaxID=1737354 RepID=A0A917M501_9BACL|nr:hypothetical protein GCM10010918_38030 [Paenibacillus radicis (ex Gao et al. 2016)]
MLSVVAKLMGNSLGKTLRRTNQTAKSSKQYVNESIGKIVKTVAKTDQSAKSSKL